MTTLMDLPLELFRMVLVEIVRVRGLKRALRLRTVSKLFASEVLEALFTVSMRAPPRTAYSDIHRKSEDPRGEDVDASKRAWVETSDFENVHQVALHSPLWRSHLKRRIQIERPYDGPGLRTLRVFAQILAMEDHSRDLKTASKAYLVSMCELASKMRHAPYASFWQKPAHNRIPSETAIVCPSRAELDALDFFQSDRSYFTADNLLSAAVYTNSRALAERLVAKGCNVFGTFSDGLPAPYLAAIYGNHFELLDLLFASSTHERSKRYHRRLILIEAARLGNAALVDHVLHAQWMPWQFEQTCRRGTDAFAWKAALNTPDVRTLDVLMSFKEAGAYQKGQSLRTSQYKHLEEAAEHNWIDMARHLLALGTPLNGNPKNKAPKNEHLPLYRACFNGHTDMVRLLIEHGAHPKELHLVAAASKGHLGVVRILLDLDIEARGAVARAALSGSLEVVKLLLDRGADANNFYPNLHKGIIWPQGGARPAVVGAIELEHTAMFRLLVERGAVLNTPETGRVAVYRAKAAGLDSMLALLQEYGVDLDPADDYCESPRSSIKYFL